jgi:murein L,D-transpeptidase YcbB/YkuD
MRWIWPALVLMLGACSGSALEGPVPPSWSKSQIESLRRWLAAAPDDALPRFDTKALDDATGLWSGEANDRVATELALKLARAHLKGCANPVERGGWRIRSDADANALEAKLREALASDSSLDRYFSAVRPSHPEFAALQSAYVAEQDPARRITLARNLERWRWMPRDLGDDYVLVNLPAFEVGLWRSGQRVRNWPVVIGKPSLATPVFSATITHVVLNPWWEIPPSIVAENGGRFSARKGYVRTPSGHWRQQPGPGNSLGKMKVSMTNPYNVYLHDTPAQSLFSHPSRAYSHAGERCAGIRLRLAGRSDDPGSGRSYCERGKGPQYC